MYRIEFLNHEIDRKEVIGPIYFKEALSKYIEISETPWWEADISDLKIYEDDKDITDEVNNFINR